VKRLSYFAFAAVVTAALLAYPSGRHQLAAQQPAAAPPAPGTVTVPEIPFDSNPNFLKYSADMNLGEVLGITINSKGQMIGLQRPQDGGKAQIAIIYPKGQEKVLSDAIDGKPLLAPNDLMSDKKGGIYFTVPGAMPPAIYYITPEGKTIVATTEVATARVIAAANVAARTGRSGQRRGFRLFLQPRAEPSEECKFRIQVVVDPGIALIARRIRRG